MTGIARIPRLVRNDVMHVIHEVIKRFRATASQALFHNLARP